MQDFASAAMVRLLVRAMGVRGLAPPPPHPQGLDGSHVPLAYKRSVVEAALRQGGLGMLLELSQQVDLLRGDPVHSALMGASDLPGLMARWQRLERYIHSHHQVSVLSRTPQALALRHHARPGAAQEPLPAESLAVLGVLLGTSQAIGVRGLRVEIGPPPHPAVTLLAHTPASADLNARLAPLAALGDTSHWTLHWQPHDHRGNATAPPSRQEPSSPYLCDTLPWPALAHQLARHVLQDPAAPHTVQALAQHTGLARRSLQRALTGSGLSCRSIVTEARARAAAQWLLNSPHGLAEIGFACGFADQPHFTREFARHVGLTPARYRQAFQGTASEHVGDLAETSMGTPSKPSLHPQMPRR